MVIFFPVGDLRRQNHRYVVSGAGPEHLLPELLFLAEATKGSIPLLYESHSCGPNRAQNASAGLLLS